jgi:hypothetical protein
MIGIVNREMFVKWLTLLVSNQIRKFPEMEFLPEVRGEMEG